MSGHANRPSQLQYTCLQLILAKKEKVLHVGCPTAININPSRTQDSIQGRSNVVNHTVWVRGEDAMEAVVSKGNGIINLISLVQSMLYARKILLLLHHHHPDQILLLHEDCHKSMNPSGGM